jgi:hypothetical protein
MLARDHNNMRASQQQKKRQAISTTILNYCRQWYVIWPVAFYVLRPGKLWATLIIISIACYHS